MEEELQTDNAYVKLILQSIIQTVKLSNQIPTNDNHDYYMVTNKEFQSLVHLTTNETTSLLIRLCELTNMKYLQNNTFSKSNSNQSTISSA